MMYILAFVFWLVLAIIYGVINVIGFIFILIWKFKIDTCTLKYKDYCRNMDIVYCKNVLVDKEKNLYKRVPAFPSCPFTHLKWMMRYIRTENDDVTDLLED